MGPPHPTSSTLCAERRGRRGARRSQKTVDRIVDKRQNRDERRATRDERREAATSEPRSGSMGTGNIEQEQRTGSREHVDREHDNMGHVSGNSEQGAGSRNQGTESRGHPTTSNQQTTTNNQQQTPNSRSCRGGRGAHSLPLVDRGKRSMVHLGFYRGARLAAGGRAPKTFRLFIGGRGDRLSVRSTARRAHSRGQAEYGQI